MNRRISGLCFVTACAMSAVVAVSVSEGQPSYGKCIKIVGNTSAYENSACTLLDTDGKDGTYEWFVDPPKFNTAIKAGTLATLETVKGTKVTCTGENSVGEYTGEKTTGNIVMRFTGCKSSGFPCSSTGAPTGEIVSNLLEGELGWEVKPTKATTVLFPVGHAGAFAEFSCASILFTMRGAVHDRATPANKMLLTTTLHYVQTKGEQKPEKFEGGLSDETLEMTPGPFEEAALSLTTIQTNEEKTEINLTV